ncbi:MAG: RHS repeat-associated core domain-containing protein [Polyangiaceae bacterium]
MPSPRRAKFLAAFVSLLCTAFNRFRASLRIQLATAGLVALITATLVSACGSDGSGGSNDRHLTEHERVRANSVAITEIPPGTEFYLNDAQGTPIVVTATDGSIKERSNYHAYGLPRHQKGKRADPFRYLANERDRGSELSDFKARPYRPELGIFLSVDPVALFTPEATIGKPGMLGPYAYTNGDPINQVDRDGRCGTPYAPPGAGCAQKYGPQLPPAAQKEMERGIMEGTMKALDVVATVDGGMAAVKIARILANPVARKAAITFAAQGAKALFKRLARVGAEEAADTASLAARLPRPSVSGAIDQFGMYRYQWAGGGYASFQAQGQEVLVDHVIRGTVAPANSGGIMFADALKAAGISRPTALVAPNVLDKGPNSAAAIERMLRVAARALGGKPGAATRGIDEARKTWVRVVVGY